MKKLFYLVAALGLVCIGLLSGCQKQSTAGSPATNAPAATNAP